MKKLLIFIAVDFVCLVIGGYIYANWYFSDLIINNETQPEISTRWLEELDFPSPEEVSMPSGDVTLAGWYFDNPDEGDCGVVLLHGYTSARGPMLLFGNRFWERGCDILTYDARGHGESTPSFHTYGFYEKEDAVTAVKFLSQKSDLPAEKIALVGASYGAATSLQAAPLLPDLAFVLADSPYQDLESIVTHQAREQFDSVGAFFAGSALMLSEWRADFVLEEVSAQNAIAQAEMPILLLHSQADAFTPFAHSEAIYAQANTDTTYFHVVDDEEIGHAALIWEDSDQFDETLNLFLAEYAPNFGITKGR